jgi:hypothetical protein
MLVVFYIEKIVYICVFMTCSISCLCDKLLDPWNVCMYGIDRENFTLNITVH